MAKPLTRAQALENSAFLRELRRDGNVRAAARAVGKAYGTMQHRRGAHPAFAQRWDAAVASANARLNARGGLKAPEARDPAPDAAHRTAGGESVVVRVKGGRVQVRAAQPGKLTTQCEQAFLLALSATANVRLSAAAAGASVRAFYGRRRRNPAFAREWRLALEQGYGRVEAALLESYLPGSHLDDAWRHNDAPAVPPMTARQALQLLYLHQKEARLLAEPEHLKRRRGESREAHAYRMAAMHRWGEELEREKFRVAEAERAARGEARYFPVEEIGLPDLSQVRGWSRADLDRVKDDGAAALFGGRRFGAHDE